MSGLPLISWTRCYKVNASAFFFFFFFTLYESEHIVERVRGGLQPVFVHARFWPGPVFA